MQVLMRVIIALNKSTTLHYKQGGGVLLLPGFVLVGRRAEPATGVPNKP